MVKEFPLWETNTGKHSCSKDSRVSELSQFGPGIVLYFQFVKFLCVAALLLTLLSVPQFLIFYSGNALTSQSILDMR